MSGQATAVPARDQLPAPIRAATAELDELGIPFAFPLTPAWLPWSMAGRMRDTCAAYFDGVEALLYGWAAGDPAKLAGALRLPGDLVELWDLFPVHDLGLIARPDLIVQGERCVLIEPNATSHAALFALCDLLLRAQLRAGLSPAQPGAQPLFTMNRHAQLLRRYLDRSGGVIAACYNAAEDLDERAWVAWYYRALAHELGRRGVPVRVCHVEQLACTGDGVWLGDERIGVIHRFLAPPADPHEWNELRKISAAARKGLVTVLSDYRGEIFGSKGCVALLSDERFQDGMPASLAGRLRAVLPWTRVLEERATVRDDARIDLVPWALAHQSELVLKGMLGMGGEQVTVGREITAQQWQDKIEAALRSPQASVVQELVIPDQDDVVFATVDGEVSLRLPSVYGAFTLDRAFVGAVRRYGAHGLEKLNINGHLGAVATPVWWTGMPPGAVPGDLLAAAQP